MAGVIAAATATASSTIVHRLMLSKPGDGSKTLLPLWRVIHYPWFQPLLIASHRKSKVASSES